MAVTIVPYSGELRIPLNEFHERLKTRGVSIRFPESMIGGPQAEAAGRNIHLEFYLAIENHEVRGGYILKRQKAFFYGKEMPVGFIRLPLSEGIVNRSYSPLGIQLVLNALEKEPMTYALGLGGDRTPFARLLKAMGWSLYPVPFYFKIFHPFRFLRGLTYLRRGKWARLLMDAMAFTGLGWLLVQLANLLGRRDRDHQINVKTEVVKEFLSWADALWNSYLSSWSMVFPRNSEMLNSTYPFGMDRFIRLKIYTQDEIVGWAVVLNTQMSNDKYFGSLRVGSIIDCFASPKDIYRVVVAATDYLRNAGVDMIISNQSSQLWCAALKQCGYFQRSSNYILAASKKMAEVLKPFHSNVTKMHINRGDGDGPINL